MDVDYSELYVEPYRILEISNCEESNLAEKTSEATLKINNDIDLPKSK